jgi:mono/diheme cytochrome c family protein
MPSRNAGVRVSLLAALSLTVTGCHVWYDKVPSPDQLWYRIAWFDHMIKSPAVNPYSRGDIPRTVVKGSVPLGGGEADWEIGDAGSLAYAFDQAAADKLVNPTRTGGALPKPGPALPNIPADLAARGDTLFNTYCATCHGHVGAGDGPVAARFPGVRSLLTPVARGYTDGYLYSIVRYGRGLMPKYGDKLPNQRDRWAIVNHVRMLQAQGAATASAGGQN